MMSLRALAISLVVMMALVIIALTISNPLQLDNQQKSSASSPTSTRFQNLLSVNTNGYTEEEDEDAAPPQFLASLDDETSAPTSSPAPASPAETPTPKLKPTRAPPKKFVTDTYKATPRELNMIEEIKRFLKEQKSKRTPEEIEEDELDEKFGIDQDWLDDPSQTTQTSVKDRIMNIPMALSLRQFSHVPEYSEIKKPGLEVQCVIAMMMTRNCRLWQETLLECVDKVGKNNFEKILPDRCIKDKFWSESLQGFLDEYHQLLTATTKSETFSRRDAKKFVIPDYDKTNDPDAWKKLNRGPIWDSGIKKTSQRYVPNPYIEPQDRSVSVFPPPRNCTTCEHYPIGFGIPLSRFEKKVWRTKPFDWAPIRPLATPSNGATEALIEEEDFFHELYVQSFYSISYQRGGFDSMRVPEQLSAGSIPFFYDLERAPLNTIGHFPRELIYQAMHLPGIEHVRAEPSHFISGPNMFGGPVKEFKRNGNIERSHNLSNPIFDLRRYYEIADAVLEWGRRYCTTRAVAAYVLKVLKAENAKSVLIMDRTTYDYTAITLIHGFGDLGLNVTVLNTRPNMEWLILRYTDDGTMTRQERDNWIRPFWNKAAGKGFGYSHKMNPLHMSWPWKKSGDEIKEDLINKKFDVVLFQLDGRHREYVKVAQESGAKIGFIQFRDKHGDPDAETRWACSTGAGPVFIREMNDHGRCT